MDHGIRSTRNELFQELKPLCVDLSQLALKNDGSATSAKVLTISTNQLLELLLRKCQRTDGVFDSKLADYVFFPLSQILQKKKTYSDSLSETTIKCLKILLQYGWRASIALDLAKQLLILLTLVAGGLPGQEDQQVPEEVMVASFECLTALFQALSSTPGGAASLVETGTIPALGHCVTVMLEGITNGPSPNSQIQALLALDSVWATVKDVQALSSFLPGTISALTKGLMPKTSSRRSKKTIIAALEVLEHVLTTLLSDLRTRSFKDEESSKGSEPKALTKSWLKATTSQIKLALSNIIRLRSHDSEDVRATLNKLCITLLDQCHDTLSDSASILVETCMTLSDAAAEESLKSTSLTDLAILHPDIGDLIKVTVYNWATGLPRVMQTNDETVKQLALSQISKAHKLLTDLNLDSSLLEDALSDSLRDSVMITVTSTNTLKGVQEASFDLDSQAAMTLVSERAASQHFHPIIMPEESRRMTRDKLDQLINGFGSRQIQTKVASEMLEYARAGATGSALLSALWLSSRLLRSASAQNKELDEFFESAITFSDDQEIVNQELFSFSLSLLAATEEVSDWRLQAVALEVIADTAQHRKINFRTELVDSLYPIVQLIGSSNSQLQEHAITCLNIVSSSCGYSNASELIIDNVDYMVNAISLRLNTFDISPQAPQVLVMMIRLTGPSLLLYLDDVVGSIFAALDNFHGYHRLVEILFSVLSEVVTVGAQSTRLLTTTSTPINHLKEQPKIPTLESILNIVMKKDKEAELPQAHEEVPQKPWKEASTLLDEAEDTTDEENEPPSEVAKIPPTKTYSMLQSIVRLSQHHLTNESPMLRTRLLKLISTASQSLQHDENEFLPLVNDIWPVVIKRVYDDEPFVAAAAANTITELCCSAGDFLSTRIKDEFTDLMQLARRSKVQAEKGARGLHSQASKVWEARLELLVAIIGHVNVDDWMLDELLLVLGKTIQRNDVVAALNRVNADAAWLAVQVLDSHQKIEKPTVAGYVFADLPLAIPL